ncbi:MAG: hypothetical protein ACR2MO_06530 [Acidimicrobiales bacterium]
MTFIAPASKAYVGADTLRAANAMDLVDVDYVARRDADKAPDARGRYRVGEDAWAMSPAKVHKGEAINLRRVFVWSSADASAATNARERSSAEPVRISVPSPAAWAPPLLERRKGDGSTWPRSSTACADDWNRRGRFGPAERDALAVARNAVHEGSHHLRDVQRVLSQVRGRPGG